MTERIIFDNKYDNFSWGGFLISSLIHGLCLYAFFNIENKPIHYQHTEKPIEIEIAFSKPQENPIKNELPKHNIADRAVTIPKNLAQPIIKKSILPKKQIVKKIAPQKVIKKEIPQKKTVITVKKSAIKSITHSSKGEDNIRHPERIAKITGSPSHNSVAEKKISIGTGQEKPASNKAVHILKRVKPEYPRMAQRMGKEGKVILRILVGLNGKPKAIHLLEASELDSFNKSALKAAWAYHFSPAIENGKIIESYKNIIIYFRLT